MNYRKGIAKDLISPKLWLVARISAVAGLAGLLVFFFVVVPGGPTRPALANAPDYQGYPAGTVTVPPTEPGYPAGSTATSPAPAGSATPTPAPSSTQPSGPQPSSTEPAESLTPTVELTETLTPTMPPDVFRTEDSEMNSAKTTPLVTETPGPMVTAYVTPTETMTPLPTSTTQAVIQKKDSFAIDWGLFWIGFSLPVLGGCGVVLYLLDRRPDIFKHKH